MVNQTIPIPLNLPVLMVSATPEQKEVIERILKGQTNLETNLLELGKFWKVKVWFSEPVQIQVISRWKNWTLDEYGRRTRTRSSDFVTVQEYVFPGFFKDSSGRIAYKFKRNGRYGQYLPINKVIRYEAIPEFDEFTTVQKFKEKFDPLFITDTEIDRLWNSTSCQHGGRYRPSDFRCLGPQGKKVLERFLNTFRGVSSTDDAGYITESDGKKYLSSSYYRSARDIRISHMFGNGYVWYSSEYRGYGRYGILANKREYLWLEDD